MRLLPIGIKASLALGALLSLAPIAPAHQLDEYLQVAVVSLQRDHVGLTLFLTPGVAVFKKAMALMDPNGDGVVSEAERKRYLSRVLQDVALTVDGHRAKLGLVSYAFPTVEAMRKGTGYLQLRLTAPLAPGSGAHRVAFENRHQKAIAAYMVNCVVPDDPALAVAGQSRDRDQSRYEVRYRLRGMAPNGSDSGIP